MKNIMSLALNCIFVLSMATILLWGHEAMAQAGYFASQGCAGCHSAPVVATCNGCHAHGTHPDMAKSAINVVGVTDKSSYLPGETVTVTITGGYRTGWIRAVLYDENMVELARSRGNESGIGSAAIYPATLTAPAPALPGTFSWKVAWYGNRSDTAGAAFGQGWVPDPNNPNHAAEVVTITNPFIVAAAPLPMPLVRSVDASEITP